MKEKNICILDHLGGDFMQSLSLLCYVGEPLSLKQIRFMSEGANLQDTSMSVSTAQKFDSFCACVLDYDTKHK